MTFSEGIWSELSLFSLVICAAICEETQGHRRCDVVRLASPARAILIPNQTPSLFRHWSLLRSRPFLPHPIGSMSSNAPRSMTVVYGFYFSVHPKIRSKKQVTKPQCLNAGLSRGLAIDVFVRRRRFRLYLRYRTTTTSQAI